MVTMLQDWRLQVRFAVWAKEYFLQNTQRGSRAYPPSHSLGTVERIFPVEMRPKREFDFTPTPGNDDKSDCSYIYTTHECINDVDRVKFNLIYLVKLHVKWLLVKINLSEVALLRWRSCPTYDSMWGSRNTAPFLLTSTPDRVSCQQHIPYALHWGKDLLLYTEWGLRRSQNLYRSFEIDKRHSSRRESNQDSSVVQSTASTLLRFNRARG